MVSDFVDEFNGFLALSNEEYQAAKATKPNILPYAREFLEYGESRGDVGQATSLSLRWIEQLRLRRSSTQRGMVGIIFGFLITAAAMLLWWMMLLMLLK